MFLALHREQRDHRSIVGGQTLANTVVTSGAEQQPLD